MYSRSDLLEMEMKILSLLLMVHGKAILENKVAESIYIFIENGKIKELGPIHAVPTHLSNIETIDIPVNNSVVPGFIDVHIHGAAGADTMDANLMP